jgi:hypothetical protein
MSNEQKNYKTTAQIETGSGRQKVLPDIEN